MSLALIWAQSPGGVIGRGNELPWRVPEDSAHFRALTSGHPVVMGRATWESLPAQCFLTKGETGESTNSGYYKRLFCRGS